MALQKKRPLPTWRDLPTSDGIPMDNRNHPIQAEMYLLEPLRRFLAMQGLSAYTGHNCFLYYAPGKPPVGPDIFVVNEGQDQAQGSWVVYSEGDLFPTFICELLSPSTELEDRGTRKTRYQNVFRTQDYFLYDTEDQRFEGFWLLDGVYVPATPEPSGHIRSKSLPLELGVVGKWLRWFTLDGRLLLTSAERAEDERQEADHERQRADQEQRRADNAQQQADQERQRADSAQQQADQERQRADAAEATIREMAAHLRLLEQGEGGA
jgi:Uma2 family endonuclease